jgi:hypothetical protein
MTACHSKPLVLDSQGNMLQEFNSCCQGVVLAIRTFDQFAVMQHACVPAFIAFQKLMISPSANLPALE